MSRIDEKKVSDVMIWDEYLIYAAAFGITDVVSKQLHGFYPKLYIKVDWGDF